MQAVVGSNSSETPSGTSIQDLDGDVLTYTEQSGPALIDQDASATLVTDLSSFEDVTLTVSVDGMSSTQVLSVRNQGIGFGQIGFEDGNITYGGVLIGELTGEPGGPLTITLMTNDVAAISALIQNLTYEDTSDAPEGDGARIVIELANDTEPLAAAAVTLSITTADDPPLANEDIFSLDAGGYVYGNVKENDFDPDDPDNRSLFDVVSFNASARYENPAPGEETIDTSVDGDYGTLRLNADGTFTYTANNASSIPVGETREDTFSYAIRDADGNLSITTITFEVTGQPAFDIGNLDGDVLSYPEGSAPLLLDTAGAAYIDGTLTTFEGVSLMVSLDEASGSELLSILSEGTGTGQISVSDEGILTFGGLEIGVVAGGLGSSLVVNFNEDASNEALAAVLHRLAYQDVSEAPSNKGLSITLARGTTLLSTSHVTIVAQPVDDDPVADDDVVVVTAGGSQAGQVTRNDYDPDDPHAVLTVTGFHAGSSGSDIVAAPGTAIQGTYGVLTLNADGTYTYLANKADSLPPGVADQDIFTYTVTSSAGGETTAQLRIIVENPATPFLFTFSDFDAYDLYYKEQSGSVLIDRDVSVDSGGLGWHGVKLSITLGASRTGEGIVIRHEGVGDGQVGVKGTDVTFSGTVVGSIRQRSGNAIDIVFNAAADDEIVSAILRNIQYSNANEIIERIMRTVTLSVTVGEQTFGFESTAFHLEPFDDQLQPASDKAVVMEEAVVSGNILANDVDPDKPPPLTTSITIRGAVAGAATPSSQKLTDTVYLVGQYGSLILNLDGTFTYEANRSDGLIAGETGTDVFTYRIRNETGDEATAQIVISVQGSDEIRTGSNARDILIGGRGADQLSGMGGNDRLTGGEGKDILRGGKGKDLFVFDAPMDGPDTILDFKVKEDKIHFLGKAFGLRKGKLKADAFFEFKGSKPKAAEKDDRILYNQKKGLLYVDLDGSGKTKAPILIATLKNKPDLGAKDFFII